MAEEESDILKIFDEPDRITRALALAARDALIRHKALGVPIAVWEDGQVVVIQPQDIEIPEVP